MPPLSAAPSQSLSLSLANPHAAALEALRSQLATIPDPRTRGRVRHRLDEVLIIALCSVLCDNDSFTGMEAFAQTQLDWLRTFLTLENGAPSHDVFRNVLMALKPGALEDILRQWSGDLGGKHIAIDGKALRGTYDAEAGRCQVHVMRAWVSDMGISAGQVTCGQKSNELEALPRLLEKLLLKDAIVTIDAMGCQKNIAEQIHNAGGGYVLTLKANQKNALAAVAGHFAQADEAAQAPPGHTTHTTEELSHGRYEKRCHTQCTDLDWFHKSWLWEGIKSVVRVQRWSHRGSGQGSAELTEETHYYLSSLEVPVEAMAGIIRGHWSVENRCHYVLDVTYGEDHCQVRDKNAAHNLSLLREMSAKALKDHPGKGSIRAKRKRAALDPAFRSQLLAHIPQAFGA